MRCKLRMKIKDAKMIWQRSHEPTENEEDEITLRNEDQPRGTESNAQVAAETLVCCLRRPATVGSEGDRLH